MDEVPAFEILQKPPLSRFHQLKTILIATYC